MLVTFNSKKRANTEISPGGRKASKVAHDLTPSTPEKPGGSTSEPVTKTSSQGSDPSFKLINKSTDFFNTKSSRRSRNGCLTCKVRKKKCDELRPTCSGCSRLKKECLWVDYENMSEAEIKEIREKAENDEKTQKLRRRRSKLTNPQQTASKPAEFEPARTQSTEPKPADSHPESSNASQVNSPRLEQPRSPSSPSSFLTFLKDHGIQDSPIERSSVLSEHVVKDEPHNQLVVNKDVQDLTIHLPNSFVESLLELGHMFNNPQSPYYSQYLQLMTPSNGEDFITNLNSIITPLPPHPPSYLPELATPKCAYLYNYYVETLSDKISIAPSSQNESNAYQKVFLPLAYKDKGVLYGILAWAGFHLGGKWKEEGTKYVDMALEHLMKSLTEVKSNNNTVAQPEDRQVTIIKLATLLILCGAEICKGDVKNWSIFLNWGWKILYAHGGILNFNRLKEEHWLISNFAYHDLLASSSTERGTYFPSEDYATIFSDKAGFSRGNLNPLLGVSKKLYKSIGDISTLVFESKKILQRIYSEGIIEIENKKGVDESPTYTSLDTECSSEDGESEISEHGKINKMLYTIIEKANLLEKEIDSSRPDPEDLIGITDSELEWQLTLFEAFQLSAKLFLKQSILKCNPSMIEIQVLNTDLIKCIDILLGTPVQASLVFPLFMSGIHCVTKHDRDVLLKRMTNLMELYGPWNIQRAKFLVEKVWEQNPKGDTVVDWQSILKELGWDINFA
ncbi:uncharacterized protein CANTADRAFT_49830 [Suhomyces tanzawaensis NRRL Y-17324]|uniref:Zn(2)-C6 fungal-type domain-containing protein n=1 Tax=Suhomyces tanzawaensis NRRL Y-17324 TaxID=984487 RepID=A0A1E4SJD1_9ASCO|nr:uncharacterized protein CANTADRAFT_49830 [Suhomyces tanzawaensis NRRL Y-17324]ODV79613.1 hypothetical protein CANTADRAFT_49830 [Suhomyces tanzawaensis NRRL Y-17324]